MVRNLSGRFVVVAVLLLALLGIGARQSLPLWIPAGAVVSLNDHCPFISFGSLSGWRILGVPARTIGPGLTAPVLLLPRQQCRVQLFSEALDWATIAVFWVQPSEPMVRSEYRPRMVCSRAEHVVFDPPIGDATAVGGCDTGATLWVNSNGIVTTGGIPLVTVGPQLNRMHYPNTVGSIPVDLSIDSDAVLAWVRDSDEVD